MRNQVKLLAKAISIKNIVENMVAEFEDEDELLILLGNVVTTHMDSIIFELKDKIANA